ncbi:MAG: hypothetical protein ACR2OG_15205 [Gemmatimonadaceae bacterium]
MRLHGRRERATAAAVPILVIAALVAELGCRPLVPDASNRAAGSRSDAERQEIRFDVGPVDLPAAGDDHGMPAMPGMENMAQPAPLRVSVPFDGWIHGFAVEVIDGRSHPLPRQLLHHVKVNVPAMRELFEPIMLRLIGAGAETGPQGLPSWLGFPVHRGESLVLTAMLHNQTGESYSGVRVRVRIRYTAAGRWVPPVAAYPFFAHVTLPDSATDFDLPPGLTVRSREIRPALDGRIFGLGGHLHRYAELLRFEDATTGRLIWETAPQTDANQNIVSVPTKRFFVPFGAELRRDHVYRLSVRYRNPTTQTIPWGGMATLGGIFLPNREEAWPVANASDPRYVADAKAEFVQSGREQGH